MASPINNNAPLNVGNERARATETEGLGKRRDTVPSETVATTSDDTVTLSETGRRLAVEGNNGRQGPQGPEQARDLVERLKEKLAANPGFAAAAHRANESSRLATLLDSYA